MESNKKSSQLLLFLFPILIIISCSKKKDDDPEPKFTGVKYYIEITDGENIGKKYDGTLGTSDKFSSFYYLDESDDQQKIVLDFNHKNVDYISVVSLNKNELRNSDNKQVVFKPTIYNEDEKYSYISFKLDQSEYYMDSVTGILSQLRLHPPNPKVKEVTEYYDGDASYYLEFEGRFGVVNTDTFITARGKIEVVIN